jgi:alpha-tubulin suppressor-like RCC1 family protein
VHATTLETTRLLSDRRRFSPSSVLLFFAQIACGRAHALLLTSANDLYTWGNNDLQQCGRSTALRSPGKLEVFQSSALTITDVAAGADFSVVITGFEFVWIDRLLSFFL